VKNALWTKALKTSADPERSRHLLESLAAAGARVQLKKFSADSMRAFAALSGGSQTLGDLLLAHPDWLPLFDIERLKYPRRTPGFQQELDRRLGPALKARDYAAALTGLRRFKQRELFRIAVRDLARLSHVVEITRELSDVADVCLEAVFQIVWLQLTTRFGRPYHQDAAGRWWPTAFAVLGLGKLGGQELNYSSDVDLMFVYDDEGEVFKETPNNRERRHLAPKAFGAGRQRSQSSHQFFGKLAEAFSAEVSRTTEDGFLFRVDLRLRPEGDAGPLVRSLESCENYYAQWGQTWERMMLIKARHVAGDKALAAEFIEMIQPFRYPHSISERVLHEVALVKDRIEREVVGVDELERNVKLGRGGIREIEFIVQSLQVLHAGRLPFLQISQTLPCLEKLKQYHLLAGDETELLASAYRFLRDVEHRLQMENNLQTHTLPGDPRAQLRLARLMDFKSWEKFGSALQTHTGNVRRIYDTLLKRESPEAQNILRPEFNGKELEWETLLAAHSFREPETAFQMFKEFAEGPGDVHVSARTAELARELILKYLALCPRRKPEDRSRKSEVEKTVSGLRPLASDLWLSDPDRVLLRLASFISAYAARVPLLELWNANPPLFQLMLLLFDRSEFLAEMAIRTPDLIDDVVTGGRLRQRKSADHILKELRRGSSDLDQFVWLRRYHETELMRLGLRDILGLADFEHNLVELSALADACLQYALEAVTRKHRFKTPPIVIVGLGKLGGGEIDYGSDLDLLFVTDAKTKELPKLQRLAVEVMELMSRRTEQGMVFRTDARLRPDGEKGLLVNTLDAYEQYYRRRAQLWEIQALTRTRPVAGDLKLGKQFQELATTMTDFSGVGLVSRLSPTENNRDKLEARPTLPAAYAPDWKLQIHQMRLRIEKERTPRAQDDLAIKTGIGGLMDAEFIAQSLCLENGWHEPNTLRALARGRDAGILPDADRLLEAYRHLRRVEGILRRWSYEGEVLLPDDPAPYYRVSVRCGFATPEEFRSALAKWRKAIREVYENVFRLD